MPFVPSSVLAPRTFSELPCTASSFSSLISHPLPTSRKLLVTRKPIKQNNTTNEMIPIETIPKEALLTSIWIAFSRGSSFRRELGSAAAIRTPGWRHQDRRFRSDLVCFECCELKRRKRSEGHRYERGSWPYY